MYGSFERANNFYINYIHNNGHHFLYRYLMTEKDSILKNHITIFSEKGLLKELNYSKEYISIAIPQSYIDATNILLYWNGYSKLSYLDMQEFISDNEACSDVIAKYDHCLFGAQSHLINDHNYLYHPDCPIVDKLILIILDRYLTFDLDLDDLAREYSIRWFNKYFRNIFPAFHDYILRKGLLNPEIFDKARLGSILSYNIKLSDKPLSIFIRHDYINGEFTISSISISIDGIDETLKSLVEIYTANNFSLVKDFFNQIIHNITLDNVGIRLNSHRTIYVPDLTGKEVYRFYIENFNYIFYDVFTNKSLAYLISDNVTKSFETAYLPPKSLSLDFTIYFGKGKNSNSSTLMFDVHGLSNYVVLKDMEELLSEIRWNIDFEEAIDIIQDNTSLDEDYIRSHIDSYEVLFNNSVRPIYFVKKSTNVNEYYDIYSCNLVCRYWKVNCRKSKSTFGWFIRIQYVFA